MPADGLPISEIALIDREIRERTGRIMSGTPQPDDLMRIAELNRRRVQDTKPKLYDDARVILARIAALG